MFLDGQPLDAFCVFSVSSLCMWKRVAGSQHPAGGHILLSLLDGSVQVLCMGRRLHRRIVNHRDEIVRCTILALLFHPVLS